MDEDTLTALKESIAHWEENAADPENALIGVSSCPLCRKFHKNYRNDGKPSCTGCPVFLHTGKSYCRSTPYHSLDRLAEFLPETVENDRILCQREVNFLKSLLPKGE